MESNLSREPAAVLVAEADLDSAEVRVRSGDLDAARKALVLVKNAGSPVSLVQVDFPTNVADRREHLLSRVAVHQAGARRVEFPQPRLSATAVLCTLGGHPVLRRSVEALLGQSVPDLNVLVVDNDPSSGNVDRALSGLTSDRLTIVRQPVKGLSHARNVAVWGAQTDVLLFTDDDAIADPRWASSIVRGFRASSVGAVTGMVLPAELRTESQRAFEAYGGFNKALEHLYWSLGEADPTLGAPGPKAPLFPWTVGKLGSGNNMAFRTDVLREIGGFDPALGAGSLAKGGEDLDALSRVLLAGNAVVYTPEAVVWHHHRETVPELVKQIRADGTGMGAVLSKRLLAEPRLVTRFASRTLRVARDALAPGAPRVSSSGLDAYASPSLRRQLLRQELIGLVEGPVRYLRSRWVAGR